MAFLYNVSAERELVFARFWGPISIGEFLEATTEITRDIRFVRGFNGVIEATQIDMTMPLEDLKPLIGLSLANNQHEFGRWALIVTTPAATAFAMIFQKGVTAKHPFKLVSSWTGVSEHLGVPVTLQELDDAVPPPKDRGRNSIGD